MKKIALLLLAVFFLTGCSSPPASPVKSSSTPSPSPVSASASASPTPIAIHADESVELINSYYNQGMYYEALGELDVLDSSGDRSVWDQATIDSMRDTLVAAASNVDDIYQKFSVIKSYLNQGKYYEARDELNWLKAGYPLPPTENQKWGEYNLDATLGIEKYEQSVAESEAKAEAERQAAEAARRSQQAAQSSASQNTSYTVYVTRTGEKYHRSGCRYLRQSKIAIDRSDAIAQGYTPCSVCDP